MPPDDLRAIVDRLSALVAADPHDVDVGAELAAIRARLRGLAEQNAEVRRYLGVVLGLTVSDDDASPSSKRLL